MKAMILALVVPLTAITCIPARKRAEAESAKAALQPAQVPDEVTLKADLAELAEERKEIPAEVKTATVDLAFTRGMMAQGEDEPVKIRDRFNKALRDRREKH